MSFNRLKALLPLVAIAGLLCPAGAAAAGVGVMPGSLQMEAYPLVPSVAVITVTNTSAEDSLYQVYVEGDVGDWLSISPAEFVLEPGANRLVEITAAPPLGTRGDYEVSICTVSLAASPGLEVGCGVKVPLRISVGLAPPAGRVAELLTGSYLKWLIIAVVAVAVAVPLIIRRRRRHAV